MEILEAILLDMWDIQRKILNLVKPYSLQNKKQRKHWRKENEKQN